MLSRGLKVNKKGKALSGIIPKCLQIAGKAYISATGEMWPCCWIYEKRKDLHDWASRNGFSMDSYLGTTILINNGILKKGDYFIHSLS